MGKLGSQIDALKEKSDTLSKSEYFELMAKILMRNDALLLSTEYRSHSPQPVSLQS
jgi:hypothetical protein